MHIIQMVQEQHAIYFGYAFFRCFRLILQESKRVILGDFYFIQVQFKLTTCTFTCLHF